VTRGSNKVDLAALYIDTQAAFPYTFPNEKQSFYQKYFIKRTDAGKI